MNHREDYLKAIYRLTDSGESKTTTSRVAEELEISDASASETIQKLEDEDLVCRAAYKGFTLSPPGKELGKEAQEKFQKLKKTLETAGVEHPEEEAREMETHISDSAVKKISEKIGEN